MITRHYSREAVCLRRRSSPAAPTVGDWMERWLATYVFPTVRPRTYTAYYGEVHRHILPALGNVPLAALDVHRLQSFLNGMLSCRRDGEGGGYAPTTVAHIRTRLISSLDAAVEAGLLEKNPARGLRLPPTQVPERTVFTPDQQRRFERAVLRTLDKSPNNAALLLMLHTGLRSGEALGLRTSDVDLGSRVLHVRRTVGRVSLPGGSGAPFHVGEPKTPLSRRTIPLSAGLWDELDRHIRRRGELIARYEPGWREKPGFDPRWLDEGSLFITRFGGLVDAPNLRRTLASIERAEGLPTVGLHGLRHTFATRWVENGLDIKSLSRLLGHSDAQLTLNVYTHSLPEQQRACMDKLDAILS